MSRVSRMGHQHWRMQEQTRKGQWVEEEDVRLARFVSVLGERRWDFIARISGLNRTGKSCRLRWMNYLRPDLKHGRMSREEEELILQLHARWGNKWSRIASRLPGRTDNEVKNYWRTRLRKRAQDLEAEFKQSQRGEARDVGDEESFMTENQSSPSSSSGSCFEHNRDVEEKTDAAISRADSLGVFVQSYSEMEGDPFAVDSCEALISNWASEIIDVYDALNQPQGYAHSDSALGFPASNCHCGDCVWEYCAGSLWDL